MADGLLSSDELAYMRATQAEARPTPATLQRRLTTRTPTGGSVVGWGVAVPIDVRVKQAPDEVPPMLASRYEGGTLSKITLDLVHDVRDGDRVTVSAVEVYEVVSEGAPGAWTTAQIVWARRTVYPAR